jgi:hypothetical protein
MTLKLKLSSYDFPLYDYGRTYSFKIYDESGNAFDCSDYTPELIIVNAENSNYIDQITPAWTTQSSGEGTFALVEGKRFELGIEGFYFLEIQLTKSGVQLSTELVRITVVGSGD